MRGPVFVDSSAWIALFVRRDQNHTPAREAFEQAVQEMRTLITTDYVFDETVTRVRIQGGHARSVRVGDVLLHEELAHLVEIDSELRDAAWGIYRKYDDQDLSFTDATSIATMHKHGTREILTFDEDFRKVGSNPIGSK